MVEAHAILGIDVEQRWRDGGEPEPLLDDLDADKEGSSDLVFAHAFLTHVAERPELVEGVKRGTLHILGQRILLGEAAGPDDAGNRRIAREPLLLDQQFQRAIATPTGRDFEHAGFRAAFVENRPDGEALEQRAPRDILRELLDRDARLDTADIGLAQHQPVERDIPGLTEGDLLNGSCH